MLPLEARASSGLLVLQNDANVNIINIHGFQHYGYYQHHRINPILMTPRQVMWILISLCSGEALAYLLLWAGVFTPSSVLLSPGCWLLSGCALLLKDRAAWTCWRRLASSASQACSSVVVLVLSQPSTCSIASTPLLTTIWIHKAHLRGFVSNTGNVDMRDFILTATHSNQSVR